MAVQTLIQVRRGTASQWVSINPILSAGEWGLETDSGRYKIGDGLTAWTSLKYSSILPNANDLVATSGLGATFGASGVPVTISVTGITTSQINNFGSAVSGIVSGMSISVEQVMDIIGTGIIGSSGIGIDYQDSSNQIVVNVTGIQSSQINDFNSSVSGLIDSAVSTSIVAGNGVDIVYNSGNNTLTISSPLTSGSGIALSQSSGNYTISVTGVSLSGHTHILSNITDVTASATEVNYIDGSIPGTGVAGKAVVLDSNLNIYNLGNVSTTGTLTVGGNLVINGITTTVNSTTTTLDDPIITLGGDTAPTGTDPKDRGVEFRYYDGSAKIGFFGWDNSTGKFTFLTDATNSSEVFSGTTGTIDANIEWNSILNKPDPVVTVNLTGEVTGSGNVTLTDLGNGTINISTTIANNTVTLGTDTIGQYASTISVAGSGLSATSANADDGTAYTITSNATPANVSGTIVSRDNNGDFSARNITATEFVGKIQYVDGGTP